MNALSRVPRGALSLGITALAVPALVATAVSVASPSGPAGAAPGDRTAAGPVASPVAASRPAAPPRPNVVLVMADDLGWADLSGGRTSGGHGNPNVDTPALDRLARQGTAFDNAYAMTNCSPTRAALLTGLHASRPGNNVFQVNGLNRGADDTLLVGPEQGLPTAVNAIPNGSTTVAETLQQGGYDTGYVGKFHATDSARDITAAHGFDENVGGTTAGHAGQYHATDGRFHPNVGRGLDRFGGRYTQAYVDAHIKPFSHGTPPAAVDALVGTDKHVSDAVADASIDFVDRHAADPFFLMTSAYAVHSPVDRAQPRRDLLAKYDARPTAPGHPGDPAYHALVEGLDQSVDRLVHHLRTTPDPRNPGHDLADNTVVLFTSDNGGVRRFEAGRDIADLGPLRGEKGELFEGGIRVPLIAWSGNRRLVDARSIDHTPVFAADYHATLAGLTGSTAPPTDGRDLSPLLADATADLDRDALHWHLPGYLADRRDQRPQSVVRAGRWKLLYSYETGAFQLYDLRTDLGEQRDLAAAKPRRVHALGGRLLRWLDRVDAPLATLRKGNPPLRIRFTGTSYADGKATRHRDDVIVVRPGEEMPFLLPR